MTAVSFALSVTTAFLITCYFLNQYANWRKQQVVVVIATFVAWMFSFSMILVLPIDISNSYYRQCVYDRNASLAASLKVDDERECNEPFSYVPSSTLRTFWSITYWTSQSLTWLIFPIMQNYSACGEFTALKRLRSTIMTHVLQNATYIVLFCVILIYVITRSNVHLNGAQLKAIVISAANTWGLVFVVLFLGFGLVELPRRLYLEADLQRTLRRTYFKISKLNIEKVEAEEDLRAVCDEVNRLASRVSQSSRYYSYVEQILQACPSSATQPSSRASTSGLNSTSKNGNASSAATRTVNETKLTERDLVNLNARIIRARNLVSRAHAQFFDALRKAVRLETIQTNMSSRTRDFKESEVCFNGITDETLGQKADASRLNASTLRSGVTDPSKRSDLEQVNDIESETNCGDPLDSPLLPNAIRVRYATLRRRVRWYFECIWRFRMLQCAAVLFAGLSVLVVFSECTFFVQRPVLSVFALLLEAASLVHVHGLYFLAQLISMLTLAYMSACIYYTVFKLRIFNYFQLVGSQQSDERSLIFSAALFCRLTPPLCLNFLGLIHRDSHVFNVADNLVETQFTAIMGHLNLIKFIADGVNLYFPLLILVLCAFTYFRLYARCLSYFGFQQFLDSDGDYDSSQTGDLVNNRDDLTHEMIDEGRDLVRRACRQSAASVFDSEARGQLGRSAAGLISQSVDQERSSRSVLESSSSGRSVYSSGAGVRNEAFEMELRNSSTKTKPRTTSTDRSERRNSNTNRFGVNFAANSGGYVRVPLQSDSEDGDDGKHIDDEDLDRTLEERAAKHRGLNEPTFTRPLSSAMLNNPLSSTNIFEDI